MTPRTLRLPVVFVGALLLSAAVIIGYEAIRFDSIFWRLWHNPDADGYLALASVMCATAVVAIVAVVREVRRAQHPEMSGYREALTTGQVSGDVSRWPDWMRHDRKVNFYRGVGAAGFVCLAAMAIASGPWWQAVVFFPGAMYCGLEAWRIHRRLKGLRESLSASSE